MLIIILDWISIGSPLSSILDPGPLCMFGLELQVYSSLVQEVLSCQAVQLIVFIVLYISKEFTSLSELVANCLF